MMLASIAERERFRLKVNIRRDIRKESRRFAFTPLDDPAVTASVTIEITGGNIALNEGGISQGSAE